MPYKMFETVAKNSVLTTGLQNNSVFALLNCRVSSLKRLDGEVDQKQQQKPRIHVTCKAKKFTR